MRRKSKCTEDFALPLKLDWQVINLRDISKQISLVIPVPLLEASREYSEEYGYRTIQEFIIDLLRKKVLLENEQRYREIEEKMKKGIGVKKFSQKEAVKYLRGL